MTPTVCFSYQVPKEIGKVGVESPTFIEPVARRKDGIQAMFAKQRSKQEEIGKCKRGVSPDWSGKTEGKRAKKD